MVLKLWMDFSTSAFEGGLLTSVTTFSNVCHTSNQPSSTCDSFSARFRTSEKGLELDGKSRHVELIVRRDHFLVLWTRTSSKLHFAVAKRSNKNELCRDCLLFSFPVLTTQDLRLTTSTGIVLTEGQDSQGQARVRRASSSPLPELSLSHLNQRRHGHCSDRRRHHHHHHHHHQLFTVNALNYATVSYHYFLIRCIREKLPFPSSSLISALCLCGTAHKHAS